MCVQFTSRYWKWQSAHRHLTFTFATTYFTLERPSNRNPISAGIHSSSKTNSKINIQRPSNRHLISPGNNHLQKCLSFQKKMVIYHQGPNPKHCITILPVIGRANFLRTGLVQCPTAPRSGKACTSY
jgi:hypothetical protein